MYKYVLKNMSGEVINSTNQMSIELAIEYFSKIKNISKENLFKIYKIEKV
jgi:uridylate kinase